MSNLLTGYHLKKERKERAKAVNTTTLLAHNIPFEVRDDGFRLIIPYKDSIINYWPTTDKWSIRCGSIKYGIDSLLKYLNTSSVE